MKSITFPKNTYPIMLSQLSSTFIKLVDADATYIRRCIVQNNILESSAWVLQIVSIPICSTHVRPQLFFI